MLIRDILTVKSREALYKWHKQDEVYALIAEHVRTLAEV